MLVAPPGGEPVLLDFFVEAPGRGADPARARRWTPSWSTSATPCRCSTSAPSSCGVYGTPAGVARRPRSASAASPLAELAAPAAALARDGVRGQRRAGVPVRDPRADRSRHAGGARALLPDGRVPREGDVLRDPELADAIERLARRGRGAVLHRRHRRGASSDWVLERGGDAHARRTSPPTRRSPREPVRVRYRGREVLTNPPPSAGGILLAYALALLERAPGAARRRASSSTAMEAAQAERTPEFLDGLAEPGFLDALHGQPARLDDAHLRARRRRLGVRGHDAPTARARASSCPAPACTSTT